MVYTSRVAHHGPDRLDTTVKSGVGLRKLLAPTWDLVGGIKRYETESRDPRWLKYAPLTREQYVDGYYALVRGRYKVNATPFLELLQCERIVVCCYCAATAFSHRHLAVDILEKIARSKGLVFICGGESNVTG